MSRQKWRFVKTFERSFKLRVVCWKRFERDDAITTRENDATREQRAKTSARPATMSFDSVARADGSRSHESDEAKSAGC